MQTKEELHKEAFQNELNQKLADQVHATEHVAFCDNVCELMVQIRLPKKNPAEFYSFIFMTSLSSITQEVTFRWIQHNKRC